jgi:hypothetical protein
LLLCHRPPAMLLPPPPLVMLLPRMPLLVMLPPRMPLVMLPLPLLVMLPPPRHRAAAHFEPRSSGIVPFPARLCIGRLADTLA